MFPGNFQEALEQFDTNGDGLIDFDEFKEMNRRYPMVLFPAFRLQDKMQHYTLGRRRWNTIMKETSIIKDVIKYRKIHGGSMPPESCSSKVFRLGRPRLGENEDYLLDEEDDLQKVTRQVSRSRSQLQEKRGK